MAQHRIARYGAWVPNALAVLRLGVAASFPFSPVGWRLALVMIGAVSDALDGFIARRLNATSWIGAVLDGVADKVFTLSVLVTVTVAGPLSPAQLFGVLARDLVVLCISGYVAAHGRWSLFKRVEARKSGKVTTTVIFAMLVAVLWRPEVGVPLVWVAIAASLVAAADYAITFSRWRAGRAEPIEPPAGSP